MAAASSAVNVPEDHSSPPPPDLANVSYDLRFAGSLSTEYASDISMNLLWASGSEFLSGCH